MRRQRPVPPRNVGAVAFLTALAVAVGGCGNDEVPVESPSLSGADATACSDLVDALPDRVADQQRRPVHPADAYAAAWGDPAIVLRCGVPTPRGFDEFATCQETNGVGWFIPEEQMQGEPAEILMTTIGFEQNVEVRLPEEYWPPAEAMVDLADAIKQTVREVEPCV